MIAINEYKICLNFIFYVRKSAMKPKPHDEWKIKKTTDKSSSTGVLKKTRKIMVI